MQRMSVDLPEARGPDHHHHFLEPDLHVDVAQRLEVAEELVDIGELDDGFASACDGGGIGVDGLVGHLTPTPNLASSRRDSFDMV